MPIKRRKILNEGDNIGVDKNIDSRPVQVDRNEDLNEKKDDNLIAQQPAKPLPNVTFSNKVEAYEVKTFHVNAKNRVDVEKALKTFLQSQDEVVKITPKKGTIYEVLVHTFKMRDGL